MRSYDINRTAPNLVCICFDKKEEDGVWGRIYNRYQEEAVLFYHLPQVMRILNQLYDTLDYPQASTIYRSFQKKEKQVECRREIKRVRVQAPVKAAEELFAKDGEMATFILDVQYRQNSTWQGVIAWKEMEKKASFNSELELIRLLERALK